MNCPKIIANELHNIQSKAERLVHDSKNNHQKYSFVSIDKYYEYIRPLLNVHNLMIIPNEVKSSLSDSGKTLKAIFEFYILHKDGEMWQFPIKRTVYIPFHGAQTCGSALSYADKFIIRTLFKLSTGEEADVEVKENISHEVDDLPSAHFDYSGEPYRLFDNKGRVKQQFTDTRSWRQIIQKQATPVSEMNVMEIKRIYKDINDDQTLTDNAKDKWSEGFAEIGVVLGDVSNEA
mgnify:FL=1